MGNNSPTSTILFVLLPSTLFLLLFNPPLDPKPGSALDPIHFLFSHVSTIVIVYLSSLPYSLHKPSLNSFLIRILSTWRRPANAMLCVELYYAASASLLHMLKSLAKTTTNGGTIFDAVAVLSFIGSTLWLWPVLFEHSEMACKMSMVMSVDDEEKEWEGGMKGMRKAGAMVEGRKVEGLVLTVAMAVMERAAGGLAGVLVKLVAWFVFTGFYYECKKGRCGK